MQRFLIQCANGALLILMVIGVPAVTRVRFGSWLISSAPILQKLTLWGLALAVVGNAAAAVAVIKRRKERKLCWEWAVVFGGLLAAHYALIRGWFNFNWLKADLLWLQQHL
jgi:hypothetical protein